MDRVWPPTILGKRKGSFTDAYLQDCDAVAKLPLPTLSIRGLPTLWCLEQITVASVRCDQCPVFVFPPSAEGFIWATYIERRGRVEGFRGFPKLSAKWTLKYATVSDMAAIDPHRKLVDWIPMMHTSNNLNNHPINMIGTPQCLSAVQQEEFQAKLRNLDDAENVEKMDVIESRDFESELTSILSDGLKNCIQEFLREKKAQGSLMKEFIAFDGVRVANASFERLSSLGVLVGEEREHAANAFASRLINRGTELELETIQTTTDEIRRSTATNRQLAQVKLDHLESARLLVKKQTKEMIQHLVQWTNKSQTLLEDAMMSRVKSETSLQQIKKQIEKEASILHKYISSGATEIIEEVYSDALKEKERHELIQEAKLSKQADCCICYGGLEGSAVATGGEDGEERHQRACFLPCMHANVCTTCSAKRWNEGPRKCPMCRQPLTERPRAIYL